MSDFDTKLKLRYLLLDWKILTLKNWSVRLNETTHDDQLILIDPVDDEEDPCPQTSDLQTIDNARSKEIEEY